jgi:hypothetical protein
MIKSKEIPAIAELITKFQSRRLMPNKPIKI